MSFTLCLTERILEQPCLEYSVRQSSQLRYNPRTEIVSSSEGKQIKQVCECVGACKCAWATSHELQRCAFMPLKTVCSTMETLMSVDSKHKFYATLQTMQTIRLTKIF